MPDSKASKKIVRGREREEEALGLRLGGLTYRVIGERMGISESGAYKAIIRALKRLNERIAEKAEEVRRLELERLDKMLRGLWPSALRGNQGAIDRVLRIMQRRAMYLGLDAPKALDVRVTEGELDDTIEAELARLARVKETATAPQAGADADTAD